MTSYRCSRRGWKLESKENFSVSGKDLGISEDGRTLESAQRGHLICSLVPYPLLHQMDEVLKRREILNFPE